MTSAVLKFVFKIEGRYQIVTEIQQTVTSYQKCTGGCDSESIRTIKQIISSYERNQNNGTRQIESQGLRNAQPSSTLIGGGIQVSQRVFRVSPSSASIYTQTPKSCIDHIIYDYQRETVSIFHGDVYRFDKDCSSQT
jgi:hypothetical protein